MLTTENIIDELSSRKCKVYHAAQLQDFTSYASRKSILSHEQLNTFGVPYTEFDTDAKYAENNVLGMVFFNLSDLATGFHDGYRVGPNEHLPARPAFPPIAYGPIMLVFSPKVLNAFNDTAVCVKNASNNGFDLSADRISTQEGFQNLFVERCSHRRNSNWVKSNRQLQREAGADKGIRCNPQLICDPNGDDIPTLFQHLEKIIVDPIACDSIKLITIVSGILTSIGCGEVAVEERVTNYPELFETILTSIAEEKLLLNDIESDKGNAIGVTLCDMCGFGNDFHIKQFARYAAYTFNGTISGLQGIVGIIADVLLNNQHVNRDTDFNGTISGLQDTVGTIAGVVLDNSHVNRDADAESVSNLQGSDITTEQQVENLKSALRAVVAALRSTTEALAEIQRCL